jgi:hypothetical protein
LLRRIRGRAGHAQENESHRGKGGESHLGIIFW